MLRVVYHLVGEREMEKTAFLAVGGEASSLHIRDFDQADSYRPNYVIRSRCDRSRSNRRTSLPTCRGYHGAQVGSRQFLTEIASNADLAKEDYSASIVRIGTQWSVAKASGPNSVPVWGKITDKAAKLEILDRYVGKK